MKTCGRTGSPNSHKYAYHPDLQRESPLSDSVSQIDLEMAFSSGKDVMAVIEALVKRLWTRLLDIKNLPEIFPRMSYEEAMATYGIDKPDIRLGSKVIQANFPN